MNILIELFEQQRLTQERPKAEGGRDPLSQLRAEIQDARRRCEALTIATQALWELLREHHRLPDEAILQKMREVDLRDGRADGKLAPGPVTCPACGRETSSTRKTCLYCGEQLAAGAPE